MWTLMVTGLGMMLVSYVGFIATDLPPLTDAGPPELEDERSLGADLLVIYTNCVLGEGNRSFVPLP